MPWVEDWAVGHYAVGGGLGCGALCRGWWIGLWGIMPWVEDWAVGHYAVGGGLGCGALCRLDCGALCRGWWIGLWGIMPWVVDWAVGHYAWGNERDLVLCAGNQGEDLHREDHQEENLQSTSHVPITVGYDEGRSTGAVQYKTAEIADAMQSLDVQTDPVVLLSMLPRVMKDRAGEGSVCDMETGGEECGFSDGSLSNSDDQSQEQTQNMDASTADSDSNTTDSSKPLKVNCEDRDITNMENFTLQILNISQGKHRVTKRGPALSYPMFTLVTGDLGIVGRWRAVCVTALQRPNRRCSDPDRCRYRCSVAKCDATLLRTPEEVPDTRLDLMDFLNPNSSECSMVLFFTPWCQFSAALAPHFNALPRAFPTLQFLALDASQHSSLSTRFGTVAVPNILLFQGAKPMARFNHSERILDSFKSFIFNQSGIEALPDVYVTEADIEGPLPSTPQAGIDWLLVFSIVYVTSFIVYATMQTDRIRWLIPGQEHEHQE
ncbi:unnamed protein product [Ranitomeya imitator]|uniref:Thioredoxin domain-containing protein n=1 Tax=Ranitomeya imitator TaxID=111125 RepID=A0ABN9KYW0_9NEOB|nr:unnamed protein product [Ranitomeya imitator]